jgi:hypothetical protein
MSVVDVKSALLVEEMHALIMVKALMVVVEQQSLLAQLLLLCIH